MATDYPTDLDIFTNPTSVDLLDDPSHSDQHSNANDAIEALEAKVGVDDSAVSTSLDYRVAQLEADVSYNVKSYGAVGNGTADDTVAIQDALDAADAAGGGAVFLPPGTYKITSALNLYTASHIFGVGAEKSVIKQATLNAHGLRAIECARITLNDFSLIGNGSGSTAGTGTGKGIYFTYGGAGNNPYHSFSSIEVRNWGSDGIYIQTGIVSSFQNVLSAFNGGSGFYWPEGGTSCNFQDCWARQNAQNGYYFNQSVYIALVACAADNNGIGYNVHDGQSIGFFSCGAEGSLNNGGAYLGYNWVIDNSANVGLYSCWITDNRNVGVRVINTSNNAYLNVVDNSPNGTATSFITTAAGTNVTVDGLNNSTANSFAAGTVSIYNDGAGGAQIASDFKMANNKSLLFRNNANTDDKTVLHLGTTDDVVINGAGGDIWIETENGDTIAKFLEDGTGMVVNGANGEIQINASTDASEYNLSVNNSGTLSLFGSGGTTLGLRLLDGKFWITTPETPASAAAAGTIGQIAWDTGFLYVCTATNTWKRVAIATW